MADGRYAMLEAPRRFTVGRGPVRAPEDGEVVVRVHECGVCGSDLRCGTARTFLQPPSCSATRSTAPWSNSPARRTDSPPELRLLSFPRSAAAAATTAAQVDPSCARTCGSSAVRYPRACRASRGGGSEPDCRRGASPAARAGSYRAPRSRCPRRGTGGCRAGETAVVIGGGAIGLFTALVARARGAERVVVGELSAARRGRAEALGLETFDPHESSVAEIVTRRIRPEGADVVFECVGSQGTTADALAATRKGGRAASSATLRRP